MTLAAGAGEKEAAGWWADLAGPDAGAAYRAAWRMAGAPPEVVVPLVQSRYRAGLDPAEVVGDTDQQALPVGHPVRRAEQRRRRLGERPDLGPVDGDEPVVTEWQRECIR